MKKNISLWILIFVLCILPQGSMVYGQEDSTFNLQGIVNILMSNPKVLIAMGIQLLMGFGLGYFLSKVIKYIIAFIGVLVVGSLLSIWSLGASEEEILARFGSQFQKILPQIMNFMTALGIMTIGPITVGFIIGAIVGLTRK